jgi:hypothetical protein
LIRWSSLVFINFDFDYSVDWRRQFDSEQDWTDGIGSLFVHRIQRRPTVGFQKNLGRCRMWVCPFLFPFVSALPWIELERERDGYRPGQTNRFDCWLYSFGLCWQFRQWFGCQLKLSDCR